MFVPFDITPGKVSTFRVPGLWIRIRMDLHSFFLLDPDPGVENLRGKIQGNL